MKARTVAFFVLVGAALLWASVYGFVYWALAKLSRKPQLRMGGEL